MMCEPIEKICPICGDRFLARNTKKVYCGELCGKKAQYQRKKLRYLQNGKRACDYCGTLFVPAREEQRYCSRLCGGKDVAANRGQLMVQPVACRIRVTKLLPVLPELRPVVGKVYEAQTQKRRRDCQAFYLIRDMNGTGKTLVVREGECEVVN